MVDAQHVLTVVWKETGLDTITSGMQNLEKTSQTTAKAQDTLGKSMDETTKSATKTGKELNNTGKAADNTGKSTKTLGQAFKDSSLLIAGFASSMVSLYMQYDRINDQTMKINRTRAQLDAMTKTLDITEQRLNASLAAGNITQAEYADQMEKLASRREALAVREQQYTDMIQDQQAAWIQFAVSAIPAVATGYTSVSNILESLRGTQEAATASTEGLTSVTEVLGVTANTATTTGLVPTIKSMQDMLTGSKATGDTINTVVNPAVTDLQSGLYKTQESGNIFVKTFKAMGTSIKNFAASIKIDMASATGIVDKLKTGFISFFTHLGSGFKALGVHILNAIKGLGALKAASIAAILTNPAFLAIAGISAAVLALSTNFLGVRDAANGLGVALGNAIPPLKGVLTWIGEAGNAALDSIANFLGFDTSVKKTGDTAVEVAKKYGTMTAALLTMFGTINKLSLAPILDNVKHLNDNIAILGTEGYTAWTRLNSGFVNFSNSIKEQSPTVAALFRELDEIMQKGRTGTADYIALQQEVAIVFDKLTKEILKEVGASEKSIAAQAGMTSELSKTSIAADEVRQTIIGFFDTLSSGETKYQKFAMALVERNYDVIASMGLTKEEVLALLERFEEDFPKGAVVVEQSGQKMLKSFADIEESSKQLAAEIEKTVETMVSAMKDRLPPSYDTAREAIAKMTLEQQYQKEISALAATSITSDTERLKDAIVSLGLKYISIGKSEADIIKDLQKGEQDLAKEREKGTSTVDKQIEKAENLAETRQKEIAANDALLVASTNLAKSLGVQIEVAGMTGKGLESLIKIYDDTANATSIAADSVGLWWAELEKSQAVEAAEREILLKFAEDHKVTIPDAIRTGSIKAMKDYIAQATGMADTTEAAMQRIEAALEGMSSRSQSYLDGIFSEKLGEDGDEIKKVLKGMEKMNIALDSLTAQEYLISIYLNDTNWENELQSLQDIMMDTLGKTEDLAAEEATLVGDIWIETINEQIGEKSPETVATMSNIWNEIKNDPTLNKNGDLMLDEFLNRLGDVKKLKAAGTQIPQYVGEAAADGSGRILPAVSNQMLQDLLAMPGAKGTAEEKGEQIPEYVGEAAADGSGRILPAVSNQMLKDLLVMTGSKEQATTKGQEIPTSIAQGIKNTSGTPAEEMRNMGLTMIAQLNLILDSEVNETLPGYVILFGEQFTAMGNTMANLATAATTHFATLNTELDTVWQKFSDFSISMNTYFTNMGTTIETFVTNFGTHVTTIKDTHLATLWTAFSDFSISMNTYFEGIILIIQKFADDAVIQFGKVEEAVKALWEQMSGLSTSVDTYMKGMTKVTSEWSSGSVTSMGDVQTAGSTLQSAMTGLHNTWNTIMDAMSDKVASFASACETAFDAVGTAADNAATKVKALQSAIDALKDKTVTITTRYVTEGKPARFGGSIITTGYARTGDSWIQSRPANLGGMRVSEGSKPELITATPLSNPFDMSDKTIDIPVPSITNSSSAAGIGGGGGGGQPITVTGDIYLTVKTQSGETLANEVKPFLLRGFSGITG